MSLINDCLSKIDPTLLDNNDLLLYNVANSLQEYEVKLTLEQMTKLTFLCQEKIEEYEDENFSKS